MANLTEKDIEALTQQGLTVESKNINLSVAGMVQLLSQMQALVETNKQLVQRDNKELVAAVQALTKEVHGKDVKQQDLKPLIEAIANTVKPTEPAKPTSYKFELVRNELRELVAVNAHVVE